MIRHFYDICKFMEFLSILVQRMSRNRKTLVSAEQWVATQVAACKLSCLHCKDGRALVTDSAVQVTVEVRLDLDTPHSGLELSITCPYCNEYILRGDGVQLEMGGELKWQ